MQAMCSPHCVRGIVTHSFLGNIDTVIIVFMFFIADTTADFHFFLCGDTDAGFNVIGLGVL